MKQIAITPQFVELMPGQLQDGVLYISEKYCTAIHKCCCGCGQKVVTPLSPVKWQLRRDGDAVTLYPSIGNWNFPCQSHYWIQCNCVKWAELMSKQQISRVQERDQRDSNSYIKQANALKANNNVSQSAPDMTSGEIKSGQYTIWSLLKDWWNRRKP